MGKLPKAIREAHAAQWLRLWNAAGRPVIVPEDSPFIGLGGLPAFTFGSPGLIIEHSGAYRKVLHGKASLLRIAVSGLTVTELVCQWIGIRSNIGGLVPIRSGAGHVEDMRKLGRLILQFHIEAAVMSRDLSALAHFTSPEALAAVRNIDEALLREVVEKSAAGEGPCPHPLRV